MDVISAYRDVGSYRGAAVICGTTHKTVKRIIEAHEGAGIPAAAKPPRSRNYDAVADLVTGRVKDTAGRISAKRLLPAEVWNRPKHPENAGAYYERQLLAINGEEQWAEALTLNEAADLEAFAKTV